MTTKDERTFKRRRVQQSDGPVPLAFSFHAHPTSPEHAVTAVEWTVEARQILRDLHGQFAEARPRQSLPVSALRMHIALRDTETLRLDRTLGVWSRIPTILWTALQPQNAKAQMGKALLGWLTNDVAIKEPSTAELFQRLKRLTRDEQVVNASRRRAPIFDWESTINGTANLTGMNTKGYSDLADFVARQLEGQEVFPELGPLRRLVSRQLELNQAELMTEPVTDQTTPFSLLVRVQVLSIPGRGTPIVVLECSRRFWMHAVKNNSAKELSAYALPIGRSTALRFTLRRRNTTKSGQSRFTYGPAEDFAPIAREFELFRFQSGSEIIAQGHLNRDCPLLVVHKQGVGKRVDTKSGVPDLDKLTAFRHIAELLAPHGLEPWGGLEEVSTRTRPITDRNQKWHGRNSNEHGRNEFEMWRLEAREDIVSYYAGIHHVVIGYYSDCYEDARRAQCLLTESLKKNIQIQIIPIPREAHGPRSALPVPSTQGLRQRAELRTQAWEPFVNEVRRYVRNVETPLGGILIIAPEWYEFGGGTAHDDSVNKRAGRITLARELGAPVQYLRPLRECSKARMSRDPENQFETRTLMAWLDLAWKTIGRVNSRKLAEIINRIYVDGEEEKDAVAPPEHVLALGILRRNRTSLANERSFVPIAIELDMKQGTCSARFARDVSGPNIEITSRMPMSEVLVELAQSGPISLAPQKGNQQSQRKENSEYFFHEVITEFCQRAENPLVLFDAVACREVLPWLADSKLDPKNVVIGNHVHAEADWGNVRIARIRTQNAPKVLFDFSSEGECCETGEFMQYDSPKWADAQLFQIKDSHADVFLSFGSILRKGRILGVSCYRPRIGLKANPGTPRTHRCIERPPFTNAWSTPTAVEITVVQTAPGEQPNQVAQLVEWLRTLHQHTGDWSIKPAPLFFERALKEYLADYELDEEKKTA